MDITQDDIMRALEEALTVKEGGGEGKTVRDMVEETGNGEERIRKGLKVLQHQGRLVVHQVTRTAINGRPQRVPAYSIKGEA